MSIFLIFLGAILRIGTHFADFPLFKFLPHIPNFAPIAAMALFGGVYLNKKYAIIIPLAAMLVADLFIGFYNPYIMISVYGSFVLIGLLGIWLKNHKNLANIFAASLSGSILFFLVTNFAVWAVPHSFYPKTFFGLITCYIAGLPFFRNTIAGDLFYTGIFFATMEVTILLSNKIQSKESKIVIVK